MPEELVQQGTSLRIQHELSLACHYADASNAFQKADTNMFPHCRRRPIISSKRSICQWTIQTAICQQCCTACCGLRCTIHLQHSWVIQVRIAMLYSTAFLGYSGMHGTTGWINISVRGTPFALLFMYTPCTGTQTFAWVIQFVWLIGMCTTVLA